MRGGFSLRFLSGHQRMETLFAVNNWPFSDASLIPVACYCVLPFSSEPFYMISCGHGKQQIKKGEEISGSGVPTLTVAHEIHIH